jgi:hypothetical protein
MAACVSFDVDIRDMNIRDMNRYQAFMQGVKPAVEATAGIRCPGS